MSVGGAAQADWPHIAIAVPGAGMIATLDEKQVIIDECGGPFEPP
jgi:hypothetical protein